MATLALKFGGLVLSESSQDGVARLTHGQRQCLELVNQHLSSKEIALKLGISPHTVDQRVRQALQVLGVEKRGEAARIVALASARETDSSYQRLIHQPPYIDPHPDSDHQNGAVSHQIRHADRAGGSGPIGIETEQRPVDRRISLPLPIATRSHPTNEMSVSFRLLWIITIAVGAAFAAGMYLAGLESLTRLMTR